MDNNNDNSFASKLKYLFDEKRKPDGTRYSKKDVLEKIPALTRVYLWRLETGKALKPSYEIVNALANFFGVQPSYFFEDNTVKEPTKDQREDLKVILRSYGLGKDEQKAVLMMIETIKKSKQ